MESDSYLSRVCILLCVFGVFYYVAHILQRQQMHSFELSDLHRYFDSLNTRVRSVEEMLKPKPASDAATE